MPNEIEAIPTPSTSRAFTIVHLATRDVGMSGHCSASLYDTIAPEGCVAFPFNASPATHYFDGTDLIAYTPEQRAAKADEKFGWKWSDEAMAWVDQRTLAGVQAAKWAEMKIKRQQVTYGTFMWDGSEFDCDEKSQAVVSGAALAAFVAGAQGQPYSKDWTLADNTVRTMSGAELIAMAQAMDAHVTAAHEESRLLREAIFSAATTAEVEAMTWPS